MLSFKNTKENKNAKTSADELIWNLEQISDLKTGKYTYRTPEFTYRKPDEIQALFVLLGRCEFYDDKSEALNIKTK